MRFRLNHLVFYDGNCGLCDQVVQTLLKVDTQEIFDFAPLQGLTAEQFISHLPPEQKNVDSIILVENFRSQQPQVFVMSKAVFRICWLLGGPWILLGWLSFLPAFFFDWAYRLVARYRYRLFPHISCMIPQPNQKERFLP
jgi:predicted DCC family thiol-disulfide oxidoreductase YuxK